MKVILIKQNINKSSNKTIDTPLFKKRSTVEKHLKGKCNPKFYQVAHYYFGTYEVL